MMRLLVALDGSDHALRALDHVIRLARECGPPEVHLFHVQAPVVTGHAAMFVDRAQLDDYYAAQAEPALQAARERLRPAGLAWHEHVEVGPAAELIADRAAKLHCDAIVMGTRGLGGLSGLVLGSVATKVLHVTTLPVTLVR